MDAFLNASTIPTVLFGLFNGAIVSALVPIFSDYMSAGRSAEVRTLGSTVINALFILMTLVAALGWVLAPVFVPVIAHGFPRNEQVLVVQMVRWLMPGIVATSISGVCSALLNANQKFVASALTQVGANVVTIAFVVTFFSSLGIFALVLGSVLGLFTQLFVQVPSILRNRLYRLEINLRHPGLLTALAVLAPVALGSGASQINLAFDRYFASTLRGGSTAGLNYATKIAFLPSIIIAAAIATVVFPLIAHQFSNADRPAIRRSVSVALRMIGFVMIPCAAALSTLAYPIVQTLFERGAFGPSATALCASLIPFACLPLVTISYNQVLGRACYACKEVHSVIIGSFFAVAINIVLSATLLPTLGARGLLLANGAGGLFYSVFLTAVIWRVLGGFAWEPVARSIIRVSVASGLMSACLYEINSLCFIHYGAIVGRIPYLSGLLGVGAGVFLLFARILRVEELDIAIKLLLRKLDRGQARAL